MGIRCKFIKEDGEQCRAYILTDEDVCLFHSQSKRAKRLRKDVKKTQYFQANIISAIEDPIYFSTLSQFEDQSTWTNWKIILKAIFGLHMRKSEEEIFKELTKRKTPPNKQMREVWIASGRRSGKSFIAALVGVYLALFRDHSNYLKSGEQGFVSVVASDREQANIILGFTKEILNLPTFKKHVKRTLRDQIELKNKIAISVKTASSAAVRGWTCVAVICEEISHWKDENSANPDKEILRAIRPTMMTVKNPLLLAISTVYSQSGVLYDAYKKYYGHEDERNLFVMGETRTFNPTISEEDIQKELDEDYESAKAEYLSIFRSDVHTFLPPEVVDDAVMPRRHSLSPMEGIRYVAFVDPASGRQDSFTAAIAHKEGERYILDVLFEQTIPFKPKNVISRICNILKDYRIHRVYGDKYAPGFVAEGFADEGIRYLASDMTKSKLYLECEPLFIQGVIELLDNHRLVAQLKALERRTHAGAEDKVDNFYGHDDVCNAAAGAIATLRAQGTAELTPEYQMRRLPFMRGRSYPDPNSETAKQEARVMKKLREEGIL
jgi:hypothetical protein